MADAQYNHDAKLEDIMRQEGDSIPSFLNAVFGFLSRHCPEKIYDSSQISGEHLINQSFCKWRDKYLHEKMQKCRLSTECEGMEVPAVAAEEVVVTQNEELRHVVNAPCTTGTGTVDHSKLSVSKGRQKSSSFSAVNGAVRDSYSWSQTIEDIEVRVPVPSSIKKGKQVKVQLQTTSLVVDIQETTSWKSLVSGKLTHNIRVEDSLWSLVPGEHVLINLEKREERWWDRLLMDEEPIDLQNISAERDFDTLPAEEQEKIRELVWNKQQQEQGKPTSDRLKMESMLRDAWDAEGSPFKGQAYDPSKVNFATGSTFGAG